MWWKNFGTIDAHIDGRLCPIRDLPRDLSYESLHHWPGLLGIGLSAEIPGLGWDNVISKL